MMNKLVICMLVICASAYIINADNSEYTSVNNNSPFVVTLHSNNAFNFSNISSKLPSGMTLVLKTDLAC